MSKLEISNFKSIKHLELDCSRVNIFIGEPNTGKSNILEALGLLSYCQFWSYGVLNGFVRYTRTTNLFYDEFVDSPFRIDLDALSLVVKFYASNFTGVAKNAKGTIASLVGDYNSLHVDGGIAIADSVPHVKFYRFAALPQFSRPESDYLLPPNGQNLLSLLLTHRDLRAIANDIFGKYGLKLVLKPHENLIEIVKEVEGVLIAYPYLLISDTLQRVIFHLSAVMSNKDSTLVFEEPESHAFPYYTKHLAETMALDENSNRYFIATHNPYFLEPIVEKTPKSELSVFVTYFEDYQTKVRPLSQDEIPNLMKTDAFLDMDKFLQPR